MTGPDTLFEGSAQKAREWVHELARELGRPEDTGYALRVLRAFLHVLRDRLPVAECAQLAAQLPEVLRGVYFEGWRPSTTPHPYHDLDTFLQRVADEGRLAGETESAYAAEAAVRVLARHVGVHELGKVRLVLPRDIADFVSPTDVSIRNEGHHVG